MNEAIVLAGGLGTRLRATVPDLPKCMAPVAGRPFIDHVIDHFQDAGIHRFVFALGYMHDYILDHLATKWSGLDYDYSLELEPLGTGGAILLAAQKVQSDFFTVLNGDTLYKIDIGQEIAFHKQKDAFITIAVKPMENFDRYGTVILDEAGHIVAFEEKKKCVRGLINGGVYVINKMQLMDLELPMKHSFEKDVMEKNFSSGKVYAKVFEDYFIDIGVPEDYMKANQELID
jgi:D-glycero-alpha-D-manno-heptose 1-phosphate guanylyltransferase